MASWPPPVAPRPITPQTHQWADHFRRLLGADAVLIEEEDLRPFECDGLPIYRQLPLITLLPGSAEEVRASVQLCSELGLPVVARGAATGLSGGALPHKDGVLLSLARLNRILAIDPEARTARVEPGVRNLAISDAAAPFGLFYAPDPSSQIACTLGGNVAENSGGVHCLKYGLTVHNLLRLKFVSIEGRFFEVGSLAPDAPGYDLAALMTGSEGMLGILVEADVRLRPIPESARLILAAFDQVAAASQAVAELIGAGLIPAGLVMMHRLAIQASDDYAQAGFPRDAEAILLCELDGTEIEVATLIEQAAEVMRRCLATQVLIAQDEAERQRWWRGRKAAFPAMGRLAPDYYCMDGTIPRAQLGRVLGQIQAWSEEYGLRVANVFHAGDGNLHPLILYDAQNPGELSKTEELGGRILDLCIEVGGTITGEHGVGVEKLRQMCHQFSMPELNQFHAVKQAFDPQGLLNPGKAVPSLRRCSEYRVLGGVPPE